MCFKSFPTRHFKVYFSKAISVFLFFETVVSELESSRDHDLKKKNLQYPIVILTDIHQKYLTWVINWVEVNCENMPNPFQIGKLSHLTLLNKPTLDPCLNSTGIFVEQKPYLTYHLPGRDEGSILEKNEHQIKPQV